MKTHKKFIMLSINHYDAKSFEKRRFDYIESIIKLCN
jgi:hypothetical protein